MYSHYIHDQHGTGSLTSTSRWDFMIDHIVLFLKYSLTIPLIDIHASEDRHPGMLGTPMKKWRNLRYIIPIFAHAPRRNDSEYIVHFLGLLSSQII